MSMGVATAVGGGAKVGDAHVCVCLVVSHYML